MTPTVHPVFTQNNQLRIEILGNPITMIVPLEYTPGYFVPDHWPVNDAQNEEIGYVTSKCFSPRLKKNIGFSFVVIEHAKQGNKIFINSHYGKLESIVVELPFWDPKKQIPVGNT